MSEPITPALSAAEWNGVLSQHDGLAHLREQFGLIPDDHAKAKARRAHAKYAYRPDSLDVREHPR